tara:strand:+ start:79 stop:765 length:687 start_codon:yes stop_codon:yes gene_type:complete
VKKSSTFVVIFATTVCVSFYVSFALSVNNAITHEDAQAIEILELSASCENVSASYEKELECLLAIQASVQSIGEVRCAVASDTIEPSDFLRRNYGCCFDRARFIEKSARYYGFDTRHVFLIQPYEGLSVTNFLPFGQRSHATSEILTTNGWLGVDSNEPFILLSEDGMPTTYRSAINNIAAFPLMEPKDFYTKELDVIYGLYSRHGNFHGKNFPGPEYVFSELLWNWN